MPYRYDIELWRGNTLSRTFQLMLDDATPLPLDGSTFVFRATYGGVELLRKESPSAALSAPTPANGQVVLALTPAETRLLPLGQLARYELERRISTEETTVAYGFLNVTGGANDDV